MKLKIDKVNDYLREHDISVSELGRRAGLSISTLYSRLQRTNCKPNSDSLKKLAGAMNVAPEELLEAEQ